MDYLISGHDYLQNFPNFKLVGRQPEIDLLSSILVRKRANSVLMVGPKGVGCTAIIVGLQAMRDDPDAPFDIVSKRIFWLNTDELFASGDTAKITAGFNAAIARLRNTIDPILVVEDTGDFYEGCRNAGTSHFINLLNSNVKNGKIQVIFEVSDKDMTKIMTWHSDFTECYTTMDVTEPVGDALLEITKQSAEKIAGHHKIKIDEDAVIAAIELTNKYRVDNGLGTSQPSRAASLLDRAMSSFRLRGHKKPPHIESLIAAGNVAAAETALASFNATKEQLANAYQKRRENENRIADYQDRISSIEEKQTQSGNGNVAIDPSFGGSYATPEIEKLYNAIEMARDNVKAHQEEFERLTAVINESLILTRDEIIKEFSIITGIAVSKLGEDDKVILRNLEPNLRKHVFGQDHVLVKTANAVKVSRVGRRNKSKPQASFLFMGPSGVGKTEVAKRVAEALQGDAKSLLRFDMSEYMERHAVSKLIGAPPGYEGFEAGGILTNAMRVNRNRIILFDEIEKAHPDVFNLFLQILDDGRLTDNVGRVADFSESIIIMTTNIGQPFFLDMNLTFEAAEKLAKEELDSQYRPEFLNRFNGRQNIICFNRLELDSIERIVTRELTEVTESYKSSDVDVVVTQECITKFCAEKYDARTGARGLPGFIISQLEPQITEYILEGKTGRLEFTYENGGFRIL